MAGYFSGYLRDRIAPALRLCAAIVIGCALLLAAGPQALAGSVDGTVTNGTTGKIAAGVDVILIALQGGMQPVANTKTDAQGRFHFDNPQLGTAPMLIRVAYKGVNYHQPAAPGMNTVHVDIYEPTNDPKAFSVASRFIVFQPKDSSLLVGEEYNIENKTQPPVAYSNQGGTFQFTLPQGADLQQGSAVGPGGMPVEQGTIDRGKGVEAIDFPFRPGENGVRISYQLAYPGNQTVVHTVSPYPAQRVLIVVPPTMQVISAGFNPSGTEQGFNVYSRDDVAANTPLQISVSGTAPPPTADTGQQSGGDAPAQPAADQTSTIIPSRMDNVKWIAVVGLVAIFAVGGALLWRRPQTTIAGAEAQPAASIPSRATSAAPARAYASAVTSSADAGVAGIMQQAERAAQGSLDEIRDRLFRLELRHQAGTISDEEYSRQRAETEESLQDLLRG
jgi:hypothetical protein